MDKIQLGKYLDQEIREASSGSYRAQVLDVIAKRTSRLRDKVLNEKANLGLHLAIGKLVQAMDGSVLMDEEFHEAKDQAIGMIVDRIRSAVGVRGSPKKNP